ncbi:MAG: trypsin-like peptidase domain-containing protein [Nitrospira sp.]
MAEQREIPPYVDGSEDPLLSEAEISTDGISSSIPSLATDYYESLTTLNESSRFRRIGRTVVFIGISFENKEHHTRVGTCTGTVVSPSLIITARHCLREYSEWNPVKILASVNYYRSQDVAGGAYYLSETPIEEDEALDYALLEVKKGQTIQIGEYLNLRSAREPMDKQSLFIVHHPARRPQRLTRARCIGVNPQGEGYNDPTLTNRWGHRCFTEQGSSGAIMFDEETLLPVALHIQGGFKPDDPNSISIAVPLSTILSHSAILKNLPMPFVDTQTNGPPLPFISRKSCENSTPISLPEVADYLFGVRETAEREKEIFDLKAAADLYAYEPTWITGEEKSTRWAAITKFFGLYFQGSKHFLKIQKFPAPENSKQLRAFSFSGSAVGSDVFTPTSWVFSVNQGGITQIRSISDKGKRVFSIRGVQAGSDVYIVAAYPNARAMLSKAEEVWVELGDLAGRIDYTSIIFGGLVKEVELSRAYEMISDVPQKFCQITSERLKRIDRSYETVLEELGDFMTKTLSSLDVQQENPTQPKWDMVRSLWDEFLKSRPDGKYSGLSIRDAKHDLLLFGVGSSVE